MSEVGKKYDGGKTNPSLILHDMAEALALVFRVADYGVAKYKSPGGWKYVENGLVRYDSAKERHMLYRLLGEEFDIESGLLHRAHEAWNALAVLQLEIEKHIEAGDNMAPNGGQLIFDSLKTFNDPHANKVQYVEASQT